MTRIRREIGERPTCPDHPGSQIQINGRERASASGFYEGVAFRCVHPGGRHRLKRAFLPRQMSANHPAANQPCPQCGRGHTEHAGQTVAKSYTFSMLEQARAIVRLGRGESFTKVGVGIRIDAYRPRTPGRPTCRGRAWVPRGSYDSKGRTKKTTDYDYRTPKPPASLAGPYSRSATTVCSWLDVFGPAILEAFAPTTMPRVLAMDSKPVKRRRWVIDEETGIAAKTSGGERNGEIMCISDREVSPATPILAVLEGGKDSESWLRTFAKLPGGDAPVWVVADLDNAIALAVKTAWPDAILYRCEEHLRKRMRLALEDAGVPHKVSRATAERLGSTRQPTPRVRIRRGTVDIVDHPLYSLVGKSLRKREDWDLLKDGVKRMIPAGHVTLRNWIADNEVLVQAQFDLKDKYPDMPHSAGGVEGTLAAIGDIIERRGEFFSNARRLEMLCGLIRLETIGLASEVRYAEVIAHTIAERGNAGMDWQGPRDMLGTSSIDALIDYAVERGQIAEVRRDTERRAAIDARRIAESDVERIAAGLTPTLTGRVRRADGGHTYYRIVKGQTVADIPELNATWRPEYNGGVEAKDVPAGSGRVAVWTCAAHEADGHLHIWKRKVIDRSTSRTMCPFCAGKEACPTMCLAAQYKDIVDAEWAYDLNAIDPTKVLPGCGRDAWWRCQRHGVFRQRISARTKQKQGCRSCAEERRVVAMARQESDRKKVARKVAAAERGPSRPPLGSPVTDPKADEDTFSVTATAQFLHRSSSTILNWINAGRIHAISLGNPDRPTYRISASEIDRVIALFPAERDGGDKVA